MEKNKENQKTKNPKTDLNSANTDAYLKAKSMLEKLIAQAKIDKSDAFRMEELDEWLKFTRNHQNEMTIKERADILTLTIELTKALL